MKIEKLIIIMFSILPFIDSLNGFSINKNIPLMNEIGTIYRIIMLMIFFYYIIKFNERRNIIIGLTFFFISIPFFHYFYYQNMKGLIFDITKNVKLGLILILPVFFVTMIKKNYFDKSIIKRIINNLSIGFPITLIIPYFSGLGESIYANGAGYKGFYYANNDLSIVLLVLVIFTLSNFLEIPNSKNTMLFLSNIFCLLITATKTSIIGLVFVIIIYLNDIFRLVLRNRKFLLYILFLLLGIYFLKDSILSEFLLTMERNKYLNSIGMDSFTVLLGGRNNFLYERIGQTTIMSFLFGQGEYHLSLINKKSLIEMDFIDTYYIYGIIIALFVYFRFIKSFITYIFLSKDYGKQRKVFIVSYSIMIAFSSLAGHVLYSALSGTVFALLLAELELSKNI